jgi:hypothetical protein
MPTSTLVEISEEESKPSCAPRCGAQRCRPSWEAFVIELSGGCCVSLP